MIDITKYKNVLEQGLLLDHYSLLCCIRDGGELPKSKRIQGFINLLHKKGYLKEGGLTDIAIALINDDTVMCQKSTITETTVVADIKVETKGLLRTPAPNDEYTQWALELHTKLQERLREKTGKIQARGTIQGTTYSFLPNVRDFSKVLLKVIITYKLKDFNKIEKCLLRYVDKKAKEGSWFPILGYYILKNNSSMMITDMEGIEEDENMNDDTTVNI